MTDPDYTLRAFDPGDARDRLRDSTRMILDLEKAYGAAVEAAADAEAVYRAEVAKSFDALRAGGEAVEAARIKAHGETAPVKRDTMAAAGMLKLAAERLEDARDTRRSLWRLIEWSAARERRAAAVMTGTNADDERIPGTSWP
jgi:hypothetical protein